MSREKFLPEAEENIIMKSCTVEAVHADSKRSLTVLGFGDKLGFIERNKEGLPGQGVIFNCSDETGLMLEKKHGIIVPPVSQSVR
jgi:hypothetical protein